MFDFPTTPADGTEYTSGGITYVYNATTGVWDLKSGGSMSDYVLKAGDTMSGALRITDAAAAPLSLGGLNKRIIQFDNCWIAQKNGTGQEGMLQIWTNNGGYSDAICLETTIQSGAAGIRTPGRSFFGGVTVSGANVSMVGTGIHWGNDSAVTDLSDFSKGLCLYGYGSTSQFGLNITSGTLNVSVQNTGNQIAFNVGGVKRAYINQNGFYTIGPAGIDVGGASTLRGVVNASSNINITDGAKLDLSNGYHITKIFGAATMQFHAGQNSGVFKFHITGFGDAYVIDKVGSVGNIYCATAPGAKATALALGVAEEADDRGVDIMKVVAACVAKIKLLETEIATLKGTR